MLIPADRVSLRSWLAWYHMLAGGAGMTITLFMAPALLAEVPEPSRPAMGLVFLAMVVLFAVVAWAGAMLSIGSPWGPPAATLVQLVQLPAIRVGSYLWTFFAGGYVVLYWQVGSGPGYALGVKASFQLSWGGGVEPTLIGMNVVPLVILWLLRRKLPSIEAMPVASQSRIVDEAARAAGSPDLEATIS